MRGGSIVAAVTLLAISGWASLCWPKGAPPIVITVHVSAANDGSGFVSPDLEETTREVMSEIKDHEGSKGKKDAHLLLVKDAGAAEIRVRIDRQYKGRFSVGMVGEGLEHHIASTLTIGDYSTQLVTDGSGDYMWSSAADSLVNKLNAWVAANLSQILARRPAAAEPVASAKPPSGEASTPAQDRFAPDYQVRPGDMLEVVVEGNPEFSRLALVQPNGAVQYPLLGEVNVTGLTASEVQRKVTNLLAKDYLINPRVEAHVVDFVLVMGEMKSPGRKTLRGGTRLLDVLTDAGGFTPRASGEVMITRKDGAFEGGKNTLFVQLSATGPLAPGDAAALELPLRAGDIITASPRD